MGKSRSRQVGAWTRTVSTRGNVWYTQGSLTLSKKEYDSINRIMKDMDKQYKDMEEMKGHTFSNFEKNMLNVGSLKDKTFSSRKEFNTFVKGKKSKSGEVKQAGIRDMRKAWNKHMRTYVGDYKKRVLEELEVFGKDSKSYKYIEKMKPIHLKGFMKFYNGRSLFMAIYEAQKLKVSDDEMLNSLESEFNGMLREE